METTLFIGGIILGLTIVLVIIWIVTKRKESLLVKNNKSEQKPVFNPTISNKNIEEVKLEVKNEIEPEFLKTKIETPKTTPIKIEIPVTNIVNAAERPKINVNISTKTEKLLLKKLEQFEQQKGYLKKDVNLNKLAKDFDTNTKYLSEIIKSYKNKNFNQYLNELRIHYLIDELNNNDKILNTKVSYLASDFGFSSHSTFSTLFTQYIGKSPSEYIKELKASKNQA